MLANSRFGWALWFLLQAPRQGRLPFRPSSVIESDQRRRLVETVHHAYRHVPYYRETMARLGLAPGDFATAADLTQLPLLERTEVQRDPERFVSDAQPLESYVPLQTGGSTARPLTVYYHPFALVQRAAYHQRAGGMHRRIAGRALGCRSLLIGHQPVASRRPVDRMLARLRRVTGAEVRLASILEPVEHSIEEIERFRPHIVCSHGSYLEALFVSLRESGRELHLPRLVLYGGDAMSRGARALINEQFGIPVLSVYGAYEAPMLGFECPAHRGFHLNLDICPVRIVDGDGNEVPDGESGEVVVSNLVNRGTILLNYRLGDVAHKLRGECSCGRTLPLLSFVDARKGDWLLTPSGRRLHPTAVTEILDVDRDVLRWRVQQQAPTRLAVDVVARPGSDRGSLRRRVGLGFAELLGPEVSVEVAFPDDLPRTARAKVRTVVGLGGP